MSEWPEEKSYKGGKRPFSEVSSSSSYVIDTSSTKAEDSATSHSEKGLAHSRSESTESRCTFANPDSRKLSEADSSHIDDSAKVDYVLTHKAPNASEDYKLVSVRWFNQIRIGNIGPVSLAKGAAGEKCSNDVFEKMVGWFGFNENEIALRVAHVGSDHSAKVILCNTSLSIKDALLLTDMAHTKLYANILHSSFAKEEDLSGAYRKLDTRESIDDLQLSETETLLVSYSPEGNQSPIGRVGLVNMGNTCFMNSSLQALLHIPELIIYFGSKQYKQDLNHSNPIGCQGQVANAFFELIAQFYSERQSIMPANFRTTIGKYNRIFANRMQQDSQEFTTFLLDSLHEDLNRIFVKPSVAKPELNHNEDPTDEVVVKLANDSWETHCKRNDSEIMNLFTGMYKSTLVCPVSSIVSITFDPFFDLTLPLPKKSVWLKSVNFVPHDYTKNLINVEIALTAQSTVKELVLQLSSLLNVSESSSLAVCNVYNFKTIRKLEEYEILSAAIDPSDEIYVYELRAPEYAVPVYLRYKEFCTGLPFYVYLDKADQHHIESQITKRIKQLHNVRQIPGILLNIFGGTIEEIVYDCSRKDLKSFSPEAFEKLVKKSLENLSYKEFGGEPSEELMTSAEKLLTPGDSPQNIHLSTDIPSATSPTGFVDHIESSPSSPPKFAPQHFENGEREVSNNVLNNTAENQIEEKLDPLNAVLVVDVSTELHRPSALNIDHLLNPAASEARDILNNKTTFTLEDCLKEFSRPEILGDQDLWYCPQCNDFRKAQKQIEIWRAPNILMIHLKRFSGMHSMAHKINDLVEFPLDSLDLKPFINPIARTNVPESDFVYELFAVDNHFGGLGGGHYTAFVRDPFGDKEWLNFDDSSVRTIDPSEICSPAAYLLFYKKRDTAKSATVKQAYNIIKKIRSEPTQNEYCQHTRHNSNPVFTGEGQRLGTSSDKTNASKLPWSS